MSDARKVVAGLPADIVDELVQGGVVTRLPIVRTGGPIDPDVIVIGAQVATTLVTFAQIPQTIGYLSAALRDWRLRAKADRVTMEARGPRGHLRLELVAETEPDDIARMLRLLQASPADDG